MERASVLGDVWNSGKLPEWFRKKYPSQYEIATLLLHGDPNKRPSTKELLQSDLYAILQESLQLDTDNPQMKLMLGSEIFESIRASLVEQLKMHGFYFFEPPLLVTTGNSPEPQNAAYFINSSGTKVMLPYDGTLPFASFLGSTGLKYCKRYCFADIFRHNEYGGQPRKFLNADFDIVGNPNHKLLYEAELLSILSSMLDYLSKQMGGTCQIYINHASIYRAILHLSGIRDSATENSICEILEQRVVRKWDRILESIISKDLSLNTNHLQVLEKMTDIECEIRNISKNLPNVLKQFPEVESALSHLHQ